MKDPIRNLRHFEQFVILLFILLPPLGGAVVLYHAMHNPVLFWKTLGFASLAILQLVLHVQFVRPYFRRTFSWVHSYGEIWNWSQQTYRGVSVWKRYPKLVIRNFWRRFSRSCYRVAYAVMLAYPVVQLYELHGSKFLWFVGMYLVTGLGVTIGYHRTGAHPSFKTYPWLRGLFLFFGGSALQGPALEWIKKHLKHHPFADTTVDPHSPYVFEETKRGILREQALSFAHSFVMWAFREPSLRRYRKESIEDWATRLKALSPDPATFQYRPEDAAKWDDLYVNGVLVATKAQRLKKSWDGMVDHLVRAEQDRTLQFVSHPLVYTAAVLTAFLVPWYFGGITVWESLGRILLLSWATYCVNSVCHLTGERPFETSDNSHNNAYVEIAGLGEGGHNTHHHRAGWALHAPFHWQLDIAGTVILSLKRLCLVWGVNLPTKRELIRAWGAMRCQEFGGMPAPS